MPFASGTAGSFAALVLYMAGIYLLPAALFPLVHALGIVLFIGLGIPAASYIERHEGIEDPGCVVIDEAAGQWVTLLFISPALVRAHLWIPVAALFLFRFFDITKLFPANRAEKLPLRQLRAGNPWKIRSIFARRRLSSRSRCNRTFSRRFSAGSAITRTTSAGRTESCRPCFS